ncbi:methyl-accepting chemotaxis protein [Brevundimonas vesicularis]|uniref:methyl-accepting chemotaxis protein n=1 Tax=Brevundimonas vesicularis TaxID=41276 RepID=UPI0028A777A8|nr:methyl-accepting chemotaxis protein [Brevundimonas vesicularis]
MSNQAVESRIKFMKLDETARSRIKSIKPLIMKEMPAALDAFYAQVRATPETMAFFSDDGHIDIAHKKQLAHWDIISSGLYDDSYAQGVNTVGQVHARIGLEPRWYIGGYALVLEAMVGKVIESRWPKHALRTHGVTAGSTAGEVGALVKATLLDMDLAVSVYLEALETKRKTAERLRQDAEDQQNLMMAALTEGLKKLAAGDLTARIEVDVEARFQTVKDDFNTTAETLAATLQSISGAASNVLNGSEEIAAASDDLSRRTEQQAASLEETAAALDQITATVNRTASGAHQAAETVEAAKVDADTSGAIVRDAVGAMGAIETSAQEISQIIGVIDEIAFQTNLLALNAGVEAARAGDAGRGFAVVASEVRALAQRSAEAAKEIKVLISASTAQVNAGVAMVGQTGQALQRIVSRVAQIDSLVSEIAASAHEQSTALQQVNVAVNQMDQMTQQNAAMVEESTAASHSLKAEAGALEALVSRFTVEPTFSPGGADGQPPEGARIHTFVPRGARSRAMLRTAGSGAPRAENWNER